MSASPSLPLLYSCISDQQSTQQHLWKSICAQLAAAATSKMPEDAAEEGDRHPVRSNVTSARLGTKTKPPSSTQQNHIELSLLLAQKRGRSEFLPENVVKI